MYCKYCGKEIGDNYKFCPSCGRNISKVPLNTSRPVRKGIKGFLLSCWFGEKSLVFTYWVLPLIGLCFVLITDLLAGLLFGTVFAVFLALIALTMTQIFVLVSVWRAAGNYPGWRGWKILARIGVVLAIISWIIYLLGLFS